MSPNSSSRFTSVSCWSPSSFFRCLDRINTISTPFLAFVGVYCRGWGFSDEDRSVCSPGYTSLFRHNIGYMGLSPHATRMHLWFEFVQRMQQTIHSKWPHQIYCRRPLSVSNAVVGLSLANTGRYVRLVLVTKSHTRRSLRMVLPKKERSTCRYQIPTESKRIRTSHWYLLRVKTNRVDNAIMLG